MLRLHPPYNGHHDGYTGAMRTPLRLRQPSIQPLWSGLALLLLMSLVACSVREPRAAAQMPSSLPVVRVSADQIARAMEEDHFFSDYGYTKLLVQGTVGAVMQQANHTVIQLDTSIATKVLCEMDTPTTQVHVGQTITVQSVDGQRADMAVQLQHCNIP